MNGKRYKLSVLPLFENDLNEIVDYMVEHLQNPIAACGHGRHHGSAAYSIQPERLEKTNMKQRRSEIVRDGVFVRFWADETI